MKATCFLTTVLGAVSPATRSTIERPGRNGSWYLKVRAQIARVAGQPVVALALLL